MSFMRFSTRGVPVGLRREVVEAAYGAHVESSLDFLTEAPVSAEISLRNLGDIHLASVETSPVTITTPADETGMLYLGFATGGSGVIDARGESRPVRTGDINVMRRERKCVTIAAQPSSILSIAIPRARIIPGLANSDSLIPTFSLRMPAARLLHSYAATLLNDGGMIEQEEQRAFSEHIVDLSLLMLGAKRDAAEHARKNGARAARRQAIKRDILANLGEPELSLDWLSRRHSVSVPYVRALFYDDGTSFTDYLTSARLDHVRGLLTDPGRTDRNIARLALAAGFGDISWFNQLFRRRFGMTPSDMRASRRSN